MFTDENLEAQIVEALGNIDASLKNILAILQLVEAAIERDKEAANEG